MEEECQGTTIVNVASLVARSLAGSLKCRRPNATARAAGQGGTIIEQSGFCKHGLQTSTTRSGLIIHSGGTLFLLLYLLAMGVRVLAWRMWSDVECKQGVLLPLATWPMVILTRENPLHRVLGNEIQKNVLTTKHASLNTWVLYIVSKIKQTQKDLPVSMEHERVYYLLFYKTAILQLRK